MSVVRFLHKLLICVLVTALSMAQVDAATQRHVRANAKPGLYLLPGLEPFRAQVTQNSITAGSTPVFGTCTNGFNLYNNNGVVGCQANGAGSGTVSSVSWTGGIVSVATPTTTPAFTIAGTSGGIPYFSSASAWASSGLLSANALMIGGGAGTAPSTTTTGANVLPALGNAINAASGLPNVNGSIVTGNGLKWGPGITDTGGIPGTVTSIATSCGLSGGPITTTGTLSGAITTNPQVGTTFTQLAADCGKLVTLTNAGSIAVTLSSTNFTAGNYFDAMVLPSSVGSATFTPSSGTVNGSACNGSTCTLAPGSPGVTFVFDGTNWWGAGTGLTQHQINVVTFSQLAKASTAAVTVGTDGSGYVTNDTITIATTGGTCSQAPVLTVTAAAGAITALAVTTPGSCTVLPTANPSTQATTSGVGTNGKAVITWAAITQTYTPTVGMTKVTTYTLGAGGGGGGGAEQLASNAVSGGAGGAGGALYINEFTAATVGASQVITVGVQGTGGLADTINTTAGGTGGVGSFSRIATLVNAGGGGGGAGGQLAAASGGGGGGGTGNGASGTTTFGAGTFPGGNGSTGSSGPNALLPVGGTGGGGSPAVGGGGGTGGLNAWAGVGGGAGAGIPTGNTAGNGGGGGTPVGSGFSVPGGNGGTAGGTVAGSPGNAPGTTGTGTPIGFPGSGGGGGASATSGTAGAGGAGAIGSGGGGGGSMTNGGTPGQGGNGGAGQVVFVEYFN